MAAVESNVFLLYLLIFVVVGCIAVVSVVVVVVVVAAAVEQVATLSFDVKLSWWPKQEILRNTALIPFNSIFNSSSVEHTLYALLMSILNVPYFGVVGTKYSQFKCISLQLLLHIAATTVYCGLDIVIWAPSKKKNWKVITARNENDISLCW